MKRHFWIEEKSFPSSLIPPHLPCEHSMLFFCSACGTVYARIWVERGDGGIQPWHGQEGCCSNCTPANSVWWQVPGSVWSNYHWQWNLQLPQEVLKRELELAIKYWEKGGMLWQKIESP